MGVVPVISVGIKSDVNWIRLKSRDRVFARLLTISVLARPGTPIITQCPLANKAVKTWSSTYFFPTII